MLSALLLSAALAQAQPPLYPQGRMRLSAPGVSSGSQTFAGGKTFSSPVTISAARGTTGQLIFSDTGQSVIVSGATAATMSISTPGIELVTTATPDATDAIVGIGYGTPGSTTKTVSFLKNGTILMTAGAAVDFSGGIDEAYIYRSSSSQLSVGGSGGSLRITAHITVNGTTYMKGAVEADMGDSTGTPGNATLNRAFGKSAIAIGANAVTITDNLCASTSAMIFITPRQAVDATCLSPYVTAGAAGFTVTTTGAGCTAAMAFNWMCVIP